MKETVTSCAREGGEARHTRAMDGAGKLGRLGRPHNLWLLLSPIRPAGHGRKANCAVLAPPYWSYLYCRSDGDVGLG